MTLTAAVVVLTTGERPEALKAALDSVRSQDVDDVELVVVSNGGEPPTFEDVTLVALAENEGIPAGRNAGAAATRADVVFFLDDDATFDGNQVVGAVVRAFSDDPSLGVVSLRIADARGRTARRHVPRLRASAPDRSSDVTTFLGGAAAIRSRLFREVGPLPAAFFYAHEETDFAWRALDAGYRIVYRGDLSVVHPLAEPSRHPAYHYRSARNRAWLARRRLPWVLAAVYVGVWMSLSFLRPLDLSSWPDTAKGWQAGLFEPAGSRAPIRWSTVVRMTRLGRPPVI